MKALLVCFFIFVVNGFTSALAQEHPFLSRFVLTEGVGQVLVDWTMVSGNTCDGTRIMRSQDGVDFEMIGELTGLCGSITEATDYRFVDADPPELQQVHYRLELGINGSSSIQSIELVRLFSTEHRVQPSPMSGNGWLLLNIDGEAEVELQVWSSNGTRIHEANGRGGRLFLPAANWSAGVYVYQVKVNEQRIIGRFVVA